MATTTRATSGVGFGTLDTSSGTPRLTGTASNIDTQALINALVQAKQQPAVQLKAKITKNEAKVAASAPQGSAAEAAVGGGQPAQPARPAGRAGQRLREEGRL